MCPKHVPLKCSPRDIHEKHHIIGGLGQIFQQEDKTIWAGLRQVVQQQDPPRVGPHACRKVRRQRDVHIAGAGEVRLPHHYRLPRRRSPAVREPLRVAVGRTRQVRSGDMASVSSQSMCVAGHRPMPSWHYMCPRLPCCVVLPESGAWCMPTGVFYFCLCGVRSVVSDVVRRDAMRALG